MNNTSLILIITSICLILLVIYKFIWKPRRKKTDAEQLCINHAYVMSIIDGHYDRVPKSKRELLSKQFKEWQIYQARLFSDATPEQRKLQNRLCSKNDLSYYDEKFVDDLPDDAELILSDLFTEPFPSLHDMPEWALTIQTSDIFTFLGISKKESSKYIGHVKGHFVNHKMTKGIILFDLYRYIDKGENQSEEVPTLFLSGRKQNGRS